MLRVTRTKEQARQNYNNLSHWYDYLSGTGEFHLALSTIKQMKVKEGDRVLEIGFGTGKVLTDLATRVGTTGRVLGVDISDQMCRTTRGRLKHAGLADMWVIVMADGEQLPIPSTSLDAVFIGFTLELFDTPELDLVVNECMRVLKPGGSLGIVCMALSSKPGWMERLYQLAHNYFPISVDCRPIDLVSILNEARISSRTMITRKLWGLPVAQAVIIKPE